MEMIPEEQAVIGGIVKGARVAGRIAGRAGKAAAKRGAVQAAGQAGKIIKTATRFATKLPGKIKGEVVKEIAKRGGVKEAGKALVKKVIKDQALAQSKKVVKNFIADSQNSRLNQLKDEERAVGISLRLMKEAERKNLIPRGSTPNLRDLERAVLEDKKLSDIEKERQQKLKKLEQQRKEGARRAGAFLKGKVPGADKIVCKVPKMRKRCRTCPERKVGCLEYQKGNEPQWMKKRCPGVSKPKDCN